MRWIYSSLADWYRKSEKHNDYAKSLADYEDVQLQLGKGVILLEEVHSRQEEVHNTFSYYYTWFCFFFL